MQLWKLKTWPRNQFQSASGKPGAVQKTELEETLSAEGEEQPVLLHPTLAERCRQQVDDLQAALGNPETKAEAITIIRSLFEEIRLIPDGVGNLDIELVGELAGLLALGTQETEKPQAGAVGVR